jgi:hypothetical protein
LARTLVGGANVSANQLGNFLSLLRLIKQTDPGHPPLEMFKKWTGIPDPPTSMVVKLAAYTIEQAEATEAYIKATQLSDEAKQGLLQTAAALKRAFELQHLPGQAVANFLPALDAAISQYAILISAAGLDQTPPPTAEVSDLVADLDRFTDSLAKAELDPLVRETAEKHIAVLKMLLQNVAALGVEAVLAAYSELLFRLRSADLTGSETSRKIMSGVWPEIERWAGRIAIIDQAYSKGGHLLGVMGGAVHNLLTHAPALLPQS